MDDGSQVNQLLLKLLFVQVRQLVGCFLRLLGGLSCLLAGVDGYQLAVLEHVVLQHLGAEGKEWLADGIIVICIAWLVRAAEVLLEANAEVNVEALFLER